jgi:predicted site-specific integrase-resolvase
MKAAQVLTLLKISRSTLYRYKKEGRIHSSSLPCGQFSYNAHDVYRLLNAMAKRKTYLYVRFSTAKQKKDLSNQIKELKHWAR